MRSMRFYTLSMADFYLFMLTLLYRPLEPGDTYHPTAGSSLEFPGQTPRFPIQFNSRVATV